MKLEELFPKGHFINLPTFAESLGQQNNQFRVVDIYKGGMGGCIQIEAENKKHFALKVILPEKQCDEEDIARYLNELKKWRSFSMCDGVLNAMFIATVNELPVIISPWMENGDLSCLMKIKERTVFYNSIYRIAKTLEWVYQKFKCIHRDLKPSNILIDKNFKPYLADWGLVKSIYKSDSQVNSNMFSPSSFYKTEAGVFMGTVVYASPEQLRGERDIDFRSDLFSLGIIMYEWETGLRPFDAITIEDTINNIIHVRYKKLEPISHISNFGVEDIIHKCLEQNPNNRFSSYKEFLFAIEQVAVGTPCFTTNQTAFREYSNLENPKLLSQRIKGGEIDGNIAKNGKHILVEESSFIEQITIASELMDLGEYENAHSIFSKYIPEPKLIAKFPEMPFHQLYTINYAICLRKLGKTEEAIETIKIIEHAKSLPATYYVNLSEFYLAVGEYENCFKTSKTGLSKYPKDGDLLGNTALALICLGNFQEAIVYANQRIQHDPNIHSYYEYGILCRKWGDSLKETDFPQAIKLYKSALLYFRKCQSVNPNYNAAKFELGIVLFKVRRYKEAIDIFNSVPHSEDSIFWLAKNSLWGISADLCLDFARKGLKQFPDSILLGRVYSECMVDEFVIGKVNEKGEHFIEDFSWDFFSKMVHNTRNRVDSDLRYYGKLLYWSGKYEQSITFFQWAERIYPQEWTYNFHSAYYLLYLGRPMEALQEAIKANTKAPWRETTYKLLSVCHKALGNVSEEEQYMQEYLHKQAEKEDLYAICKSI